MNEIYPVPEQFVKTARTNEQEYFERYQQSVDDPDTFWAEAAKSSNGLSPLTKLKIRALIKTALK